MHNSFAELLIYPEFLYVKAVWYKYISQYFAVKE